MNKKTRQRDGFPLEPIIGGLVICLIVGLIIWRAPIAREARKQALKNAIQQEITRWHHTHNICGDADALPPIQEHPFPDLLVVPF